MHNTCIVLISHYLDDITLNRWKDINNTFDNPNLVITSDSYIAANSLGLKPIFLSEQEIFSTEYKKSNSLKVVPGNCDLLFLAIKKIFPQFGYYLFIEYDVFSPNNFFDINHLIKNDDTDLISAYFFEKNEIPNYGYWKNISFPFIEKKLMASFMPFVRISNDLLNQMDYFYKNGVLGHANVLVPTIANIKNMKMKTWNELAFEKNIPELTNDLCYNSNKINAILTKNHLYHPVKKTKTEKYILEKCQN